MSAGSKELKQSSSLTTDVIDMFRLAAELESEDLNEEPALQTAPGPTQEAPGAVRVDEEVLERLRGMEQQIQMALVELKKKDQQLAAERSSLGRFKVTILSYFEVHGMMFIKITGPSTHCFKSAQASVMSCISSV